MVTEDMLPELGHAFEEVFGGGEGGAGAHVRNLKL